MNPRYVSMLALSAFAFVTAVAGAAVTAPVDGLVAVRSSDLDALLLRPGSNLEGYRRVLVDAPTVAMQRGWLKRMNSTRDVARWLRPDDADAITESAAEALRGAVTQAFVARGYAVVTAPGPGVLRLTARVPDMFVNAPYVPLPGAQAEITHDDAGTATMELDARDALSGELLGRAVERSTASQLNRYERATGVSNRFWFDAMFSAWARDCAVAFSSPAVAR